MSPIRFSVVVTCYNQAAFIANAVESVLRQLHPATECIVVDDGSKDGSVEVLNRYSDAIQLVTSERNQGAVAARNTGASLAKGEYLVFLDGDDLLTDWALGLYETVVKERRPALMLARTLWFQGEVPAAPAWEPSAGIEIFEFESLLAKDRPWGLSASALIVNRQAFWDVAGWSEGLFQLDCQDLFTKLICSGRLILIASPPTVFYRLHTQNSILKVPPFLRNLNRLIAKERRGEYPGGRGLRLQRWAWFGGLSVFWIKRALGAGLYRDAVKLACSTSPMVVAAIARHAVACTKGRRPITRVGLPRETPQLPIVLGPADGANPPAKLRGLGS